MRLYADPAATTCRPILMLCAEQGAEIEVVPVDLAGGEHLLPAFRAINPAGLVPVLEDGAFRLTESAAILRYLATLWGSPLYPEELRPRARVDEALDLVNTGLLRDLAFGHVYPQLFRSRHGFADRRAQDAVVQRGGERAADQLALLDHRLAREGDFLAGPDISIADLFGAAVVTVADLTGFPLRPYRHMARWLAVLRTRPSWRRAHVIPTAHEAEQPIISRSAA